MLMKPARRHLKYPATKPRSSDRTCPIVFTCYRLRNGLLIIGRHQAQPRKETYTTILPYLINPDTATPTATPHTNSYCSCPDPITESHLTEAAQHRRSTTSQPRRQTPPSARKAGNQPSLTIIRQASQMLSTHTHRNASQLLLQDRAACHSTPAPAYSTAPLYYGQLIRELAFRRATDLSKMQPPAVESTTRLRADVALGKDTGDVCRWAKVTGRTV